MDYDETRMKVEPILCGKIIYWYKNSLKVKTYFDFYKLFFCWYVIVWGPHLLKKN